MAPVERFNEEKVETLLRGRGQSSPGWSRPLARAQQPRIMCVSFRSSPGPTRLGICGSRRLTSALETSLLSLNTGEATVMLESSGRERQHGLVTQHLCPLPHRSDFPSEGSPGRRVGPGAWRPHDTSTHCSVQPMGARPTLSLGDSPSSEAVIQGQEEEGQRPKSR